MTENDELMAKIGRLAGKSTRRPFIFAVVSRGTGQINRHKNQSTPSHQSQHVSRHAPSHPGWTPYQAPHHYNRGRGGRHLPPHRHRTLVLNNGASGSTQSSTSSPGPPNDDDVASRTLTTPNGWVTKIDRHKQLINSAVYDKETQARARAMEETRKFKEQKRTQREQAKVLRYAQGPAGAATVAPTAQPSASHQILVNDVPFRITNGGSKLVRISSTNSQLFLSSTGAGLPVSDDPTTANTTPKRVTVAGVSFVRSKNGNLHRLGAVTSKKFVMILTDTIAYADTFH